MDRMESKLDGLLNKIDSNSKLLNECFKMIAKAYQVSLPEDFTAKPIPARAGILPTTLPATEQETKEGLAVDSKAKDIRGLAGEECTIESGVTVYEDQELMYEGEVVLDGKVDGLKVLILAKEDKVGIAREFETMAEQRDAVSSFIHKIKPRRRKKKRPKKEGEKNKKRRRINQIVKMGIG